MAASISDSLARLLLLIRFPPLAVRNAFYAAPCFHRGLLKKINFYTLPLGAKMYTRPARFLVALVFAILCLAACAAARGITEAPSVITPAPEAPCTLTNSIPGCGVSLQHVLDLTFRVLIVLQIPCLISAGSAAGCSNPLDLACQCKAGPQIRSLAAPCVKSKCSPELGSSLDSVADAICTECV